MREKIAFHNRINVSILVVLLVLVSITALIVGTVNKNNIRRLYEENFTERVLLTNALMATVIDSEDVNFFVELMKNQSDEFKQRQIGFYHDRMELWSLQETGASEEEQQVLSERLEGFHSDMAALKTEQYWDTVNELKHLKEVSRSTYLYVMADIGLVTEGGETLYSFIFDADDDPVYSGINSDGLGTCDISEDTIITVYETKKQMDWVDYYSGEYGELYYAYAPIFNADGDVIAVFATDLDLSKMNESIAASSLLFNTIFLTSSIITILIIFSYLNRKIVAPIRGLTNTAHELAEGNIYAKIQESALRQRSEIGMLARAVSDMGHVYQDMIMNVGNLFAAANIGKLNVRSDASKFKGDIRKLVKQINGTLDATTLYLNSIPESIFIMSKDLEIYFYNECFGERFGDMSASEFVSRLFHSENEADARVEQNASSTIGFESAKADIGDRNEKEFLKEKVAEVLKQENVSDVVWINDSCFSVILKEIVLNEMNENSILIVANDITDIKRFADEKIEAERKALEMKHEKEKAETSAKAKNDFLAKMSHEIRTPMNAVMGMSELILRKNLPQDVYENALLIKSASVNLLSIINDILDFSKIESGMMEIVETEYSFPSLIHDVIGIIRVRLIDKPVQFAVRIDPDIPALLIGDEIRIRQTLINLLSNAVKYTNEGSISLIATGVIVGTSVTLSIDITDTGIGVKEEDVGKLFGDFVQIDTAANKGIEGTGLGLAISRNLCRMMGGDISVCSEYKKGSTFTVTLPQRFETYIPFAHVNLPAEKAVLLYETRRIYKDSLIAACNSLGVLCKSVDSISELFEEMEKYPFMFISSFLYGSVSPVLPNLNNPPKLVLLADITEMNISRNISVLALPTHSLSIANILNDIHQDYSGTVVSGLSFTAPEAKVLIVDDVKANLKVCEGLLLPYEMQLTLCSGGREAIELISKNEYDLVFMDHMMPEMDGLEVTSRIRAMDGEYFKLLPIIALTANAISGVREMFIQNGMNDFLAKPMETAKLDAILGKWIPKQKRMQPKAGESQEEESDFVTLLRSVPELSVDKALAALGGSSKTYERVVRLSIRLLPENIERLNMLIDTSLPNYSIEVHGIKGVLHNVGAYQLGEMAFELEELSKNGELDLCLALHPGFANQLSVFSDSVCALFAKDEEAEKAAGDVSALEDALPRLEEAVDFADNASALKVILPIGGYTYGQELDNIIVNLTEAFERFDFDEAAELLNRLKDEIQNSDKI